MATAVRSSPIPPQGNNKRKRGPNEDLGRSVKAPNPNGDHDYSVLLQHLDPSHDDSTRTAQAALAAPMGQAAYPDPASFDANTGMPTGFDDVSPGQGMYDGRQSQGQTPSKPAVGTNEWHQQRKDNHKEVERRRREVINEGIENIAKIIPGAEKNKGAILQQTSRYIQELAAQVKSFENERATFEIALKELTSRNDRMKDSARQAWQESAKWQQRCRDAGLQFDDYDGGALGGLEDEDLDGAVGP